MTANEILNKYLEALQMSDSSPIDLQNVILDILKYLDYKESGGDADPLIPQYLNDKLWAEIKERSFNVGGEGVPAIELPVVREILEKYKILGDEKDGM
ncbi:MAG: hypothetical protein WC619_01835 [Patescibacteria group bacterium]